jgi:uncharacterized protein YprB with RNaseH-like and TPR domain
VTGTDLAALRARLASIEHRPVRASTPPRRHEDGLPPDCRWEETPHGRVAMREEWVPATGDDEVELTALAGCLDLDQSEVRRPIYLDTETTGLSGGTGTVPFLVGLAWADGPGLRIVQYFLADLGQERPLLWAVGERLRGGLLVTYNGRTFDWPLLQTRLVISRLPSEWPAPRHVDLLTLVRRIFRPRLPNCALRTVEAAILAIERTGDLPGSLIPGRYFAWLRNGVPAQLEAVFQHNRQDVASLAVLLQVMEHVLRDGKWLRPVDRFGRARFLEARGLVDQALAEYAELWRMRPDTISQGALGLRLARLLRRRGRWRQAQAVLEECWATQSYPYPAAIELAKLLEHQVRDVPAARRLVVDALGLLAVAVVGDDRWRKDLERRRARLDQRLTRWDEPVPLSLPLVRAGEGVSGTIALPLTG